MKHFALIATIFGVSSGVCGPALADADEDLVRLPGQGQLRSEQDRERIQADRLKPGGGLFLTFDGNGDGLVTPTEIGTGIPLAFAEADANQDGYLTALEQRAWAERLPTRDDSLANPTRFDPNLDRRVDLAEFTDVVTALSVDYADEETGLLMITDLRFSGRTMDRITENPEAEVTTLPQPRPDRRTQR